MGCGAVVDAAPPAARDENQVDDAQDVAAHQQRDSERLRSERDHAKRSGGVENQSGGGQSHRPPKPDRYRTSVARRTDHEGYRHDGESKPGQRGRDDGGQGWGSARDAGGDGVPGEGAGAEEVKPESSEEKAARDDH